MVSPPAGYERYNAMRADPDLCFLERVGMPDVTALTAELGGRAEGTVEMTDRSVQALWPRLLLLLLDTLVLLLLVLTVLLHLVLPENSHSLLVFSTFTRSSFSSVFKAKEVKDPGESQAGLIESKDGCKVSTQSKNH